MNSPQVNRDLDILIQMAAHIRRQHPYQPSAEYHRAAEYLPVIILEIVRRHEERKNAFKS